MILLKMNSGIEMISIYSYARFSLLVVMLGQIINLLPFKQSQGYV